MIDLEYLTEAQYLKYRDWIDNRPEMPMGVSGGRFTYQVTPTTLGTIFKIVDNCTQESIDLTDYNLW